MIAAKFLVSKNTLCLVDRCTSDCVLLMNDKVCTNCSIAVSVTTNDAAVLIRTNGSVNENLIRCPIRTVVQIEAMTTFDANKTPLRWAATSVVGFVRITSLSE